MAAFVCFGYMMRAPLSLHVSIFFERADDTFLYSEDLILHSI